MPEDTSAFHERTSVVALLPGERLVAAAVDTGPGSAIRTLFVIYEAI